MNNLKMEGGRLINDRPIGMSGISHAAQLRKQNKSRSLTQDIADGIELAQNRSMIVKFLK